MTTLNTAQLSEAIGGGLLLAAGFLAAIWHGVIVISFSVRVIPPWSRKAPEKKQATTNSVAPAAGENPAVGAAVPKPTIREVA